MNIREIDTERRFAIEVTLSELLAIESGLDVLSGDGSQPVSDNDRRIDNLLVTIRSITNKPIKVREPHVPVNFK